MLKFNNINVTSGKKKILHNISFSLTPHKITVVIGRNGSGKSTLVSCITGQTNYTGEIMYGDQNIALIPSRERAQIISVLPQILPKTSLTAKELTAMGRTPYLDLGKRMSDNDKQHIKKALEITGLSILKMQSVSSMSGGERQKAYLSMILAQNTRIMILDEPTTYMDMENQAEFLELTASLKSKHKKTIMMVMHDLTKAVEIADNILILDGGRCSFFGSAADCISSGIIEQTFGVKKSSYNDNGVMRTLYY